MHRTVTTSPCFDDANPESASTYRDTSLIRNRALVGPYSRIVPRTLWSPYGGGLFLMSEVPLYHAAPITSMHSA